MKISGYQPQICVGNEQGTHFFEGEQAVLPLLSLHIWVLERDGGKVSTASLVLYQGSGPSCGTTLAIISWSSGSQSVKCLYESDPYIFCCEKKGKNKKHRRLDSQTPYMLSKSHFPNVSQYDEERNLQSPKWFPLKTHFKANERTHSFFFPFFILFSFFLFLSLTLWLTNDFDSVWMWSPLSFVIFLERNKYLLFMKLKQKVDTLQTKKKWPKVTVISILAFLEGWCFLLQGDGSEGGMMQVGGTEWFS